MFNLRAMWSGRRDTPVARKVAPPSNRLFRPQVEGFEDRTVPAAPAGLGPVLMAPAAVNTASLLPINISSVAFTPATGVINAVGTIGNQAFTATGLLTLTAQAQQNRTTPILHLELNPIHLNLLGLKVDTSKICLDISATSGQGQLLGNLLTGVANLLNGPNPPALGGILGGLTTTQLSNLTSGLTGVLNDVFGALGSPGNVSGASTDILNLSLGPVKLNLLGLKVALDNCAGGPVTVDITAQSGQGQLLGNLLTSVAGLLDGPAGGRTLSNALDPVVGEINNLLQ